MAIAISVLSRNVVLNVLFIFGCLVMGWAPAEAYEVWLTDQSDTGKESGGFLYIYDGAQLAANPTATKPAVTIDFAGDVNKMCEHATQQALRRPPMLFFAKHQSHAIVSFLSGQPD